MAARRTYTPQQVLWAYTQGCFPMAGGRRGEMHWYSPDPRAILPLDELRVSRSLAKRIRRGDFVVTINRCFEEVIRQCAAPRDSEGLPWISDEIITIYTQLHRAGFGHSVEAWLSETSSLEAQSTAPRLEVAPPGTTGQLAGGLYGLSIGGAFFGESMFTRATDASKVCLVRLVEHLRERGLVLLDSQIANPHMAQFGVIEIPRAQYIRRLEQAIALDVSFADVTG